MNHWSAIQHDVNIFCSCVTRIQDRNQSGCSVDDKVHIFLQTNYVSFMPSFHNFKFMCTLKYTDCKRMCTVQGRRQEAQELCLNALLENSEGQAQVDGKTHSKWWNNNR
jgi:hypothetical protein